MIIDRNFTVLFRFFILETTAIDSRRWRSIVRQPPTNVAAFFFFHSARRVASCHLGYSNTDTIKRRIVVNVITNSGNLKQPGRDTILIETTTTTATITTTTTTTTTTTGVILCVKTDARVIREPASILFCFVCLFVSCLLRDFTLASGEACARCIRESTSAPVKPI
ncbi:unnamed protein product [Xylocopa violacea]|uniref:Uncharacterized protein n=1 Tax=Xylocopa violacea TaxID=135666 RepID=A0ABP1PE44_XYLVO